MSEPGPVTVRPATAEDAGIIAAIRVAGWQHAYRGHLDDERLEGMSAEADEPRWRAHLEKPPTGHRGLIAERQGVPVGFATFGPSRDPDDEAAELYALYVLPRAIGTGVGHALLEQVVTTLRAHGYDQSTLWVLESNAGARHFYEREGWWRDGEPKNDVLDGFAIREVRYRYRFDR